MRYREVVLFGMFKYRAVLSTSAMETTERQDLESIEFLKAQLKITAYEALALVAVVFGRTQPVSVAVYAGIPRSKVYGALHSLTKRGIITKTQEGGYEPNSTIISSIKEEANRKIKRYIEFLERLAVYSAGSGRIASKIKEDIRDILQALGYKVETGKGISEKLAGDAFAHNLRRFFMMYPLRSYSYAQAANVSKTRLFRARHELIDEFLESSPKSTFGVMDLIGESHTSGIRVGIIILTSDKLVPLEFIVPTIGASLDTLYCTASLIFVSPDLSTDYIDKLVKVMKEFASFDRSRNIQLVLPADDHRNTADHFLRELDLKWIKLKTRLGEMDELKDKLKGENREILVLIDETRQVKGYFSHTKEYESVYLDILNRIRRDLETNEELFLQLEERLNRLYEYFDRKYPINPNELSSADEIMKELMQSIEEKKKEIRSFGEEVGLIDPRRSPYKKFGFTVNPFSLTVPLSKPDLIINEDSQKERMTNYIHNITAGSDRNVVFLIGKEGMGKSHFMNYFASKINDGEYGKAIAITIQCKPKRDLIEHYPQILVALRRAAVELKDRSLESLLSRIETETETPRLMIDMKKFFKGISDQIATLQYKGLFIFVDEYENTLPAIPKEANHVSRDRVSIPPSIAQLDSLSQSGFVALIMTIRKEFFEHWKQEIKEHVTKFDEELAIHLDNLSLDHAEDLIRHRLTSSVFRTENKGTPPDFEPQTIKVIWNLAQGNPRTILRLATGAFRRAIAKETSAVTADFVQ